MIFYNRRGRQDVPAALFFPERSRAGSRRVLCVKKPSGVHYSGWLYCGLYRAAGFFITKALPSTARMVARMPLRWSYSCWISSER